MAYHVNTQTGEAGKCSATKGKCPFGSAEEHFTSAKAAREAFEKTQAGSFKKPTKLATPTPKQAAQALRDSVREFLDRSVSDEEREEIKAYWKTHGVTNKFAAMLRAAELDNAMAVDEAENSVLEHSVSLGKLSVEGTERGSISDALDFDRVLAKGSDGNFFAGTRESGPDTSWVEDVDKTDVGDGWILITNGMSGQQGYKGPWLHASEQIEGGVAQRVADGEPGLYVAVIGSGPDDDENRLYNDETGEPVEMFDEDGDPVDIGWAIAYKPFDAPKK
jgi:hypothetical protein